jgi:hypothetical protein
MLILRPIEIRLVGFELLLQRLGQIKWENADSDKFPVEVYGKSAMPFRRKAEEEADRAHVAKILLAEATFRLRLRCLPIVRFRGW